MLSLSHYTFREKLKYQCLKNNCTYKEIDERNTTKQCSNCNHLNKIGSEKVFKCKKCKFSCDRVVNASINIYNK